MNSTSQTGYDNISFLHLMIKASTPLTFLLALEVIFPVKLQNDLKSLSFSKGYQGYIPHVRAENMFGRTYGNLTKISADPEASKNFAYNQGRVTLTSKDTFFNQKKGAYPTVSVLKIFLY